MSDSYIPDNEPRCILSSLEELAAKKLPHAPTFRKAADEITRLRAENEKLREVLNDVTKELDQYVNIFKGYQGMKMNNAQAALRAAAASLNGAENE